MAYSTLHSRRHSCSVSFRPPYPLSAGLERQNLPQGRTVLPLACQPIRDETESGIPRDFQKLGSPIQPARWLGWTGFPRLCGSHLGKIGDQDQSAFLRNLKRKPLTILARAEPRLGQKKNRLEINRIRFLALRLVSKRKKIKNSLDSESTSLAVTGGPPLGLFLVQAIVFTALFLSYSFMTNAQLSRNFSIFLENAKKPGETPGFSKKFKLS
jgi:hypothetical protein